MADLFVINQYFSILNQNIISIIDRILSSFFISPFFGIPQSNLGVFFFRIINCGPGIERFRDFVKIAPHLAKYSCKAIPSAFKIKIIGFKSCSITKGCYTGFNIPS